MLVTGEEFTATLLTDGRVLVAGGHPRGASPLATAELYDPSTGTWIATATMVEGRHRQMAIRLLDGRVLVAGGSGPEVLDPATGQYSVPNLASAEAVHARQRLLTCAFPRSFNQVLSVSERSSSDKRPGFILGRWE